MKNNHVKSAFERQRESYLRAGSYINHARKNKTPLSREFLRTPYGLEVAQCKK